MAWTSDDLTALERAIANGTRSVRYKDRSVEYRSLDEMIRIRDLITQSLASRPAPSAHVAQFGRGR